MGIHIDMPGVMVIGFYKVNGKYIKGSPEIQLGDLITQVEDQKVSSISELERAIEQAVSKGEVTLLVSRNQEIKKIKMEFVMVDGIYKTGLYVKDGITGIGTLTYIDPETKIYGALGHEVIESTSESFVEVKSGSIFESTITSIRKSSQGIAGEKNATLNSSHVYGDIQKNSSSGIYGIYQEKLLTSPLEIAQPSEIKLGEAEIYTVLKGTNKQPYKIEITSTSNYHDTKNITFKITDSTLLDKTGGIVQGMSGSPIVQNNKIIGAVTHVIVDQPYTGYGIYITTMLENGDQIKTQE